MKYLKTFFALAIMASIAACSSTVTLQDITAQEEEARSELQELKEEMVKLAEMKEAYSVDSKEARMDEINDRKRAIRKDLNSIDDLTSENLDAGKAAMVNALKQEEKQIDEEMDALEKMEKEEWSSSVETINEKIEELSQQINMITANLKQQ